MSPKGARRPILGLDGLVHGPTRLALLWALYHRGESSYKQIEEATQIPRSNVCTQALRLNDAALVKIRTERRNRRPVTLVDLTAKGRQKLEAHADAYRSMERGTRFAVSRETSGYRRERPDGSRGGTLAGGGDRA